MASVLFRPHTETVLYDVAGVRALDRGAIEAAGIPGLELMIRAGTACLRAIAGEWPGCRRIAVVCGSGNNAGDGYVVARLARSAGHAVRVIECGDPAGLGDDARACRNAMIEGGIETESGAEALAWADVIVDGLFGIGLTRAVTGRYAELIGVMNGTGAPIASIDIPSGIDGDTGVCRGAAVRAALTVTFIGAKRGLYTGDAPAHSGRIVFDDLGVPDSVYRGVDACARLLGAADLVDRFAPRERTAHKGDNGHVLVIGGAPGFTGAARLAGEAAGRVGAGLVSVALHPDGAAGVNAARPELMVHATANPSDCRALLERADVVAIGPGLGQTDWATALFAAVIEQDLPLVIDADALNLLAHEPVRLARAVLTPHPGEAARLLGCTTAQIHADRFAAAAALCERYGATVVLKGAGSIVAGDGLPTVIDGGNPGMGSGGMGDVLTGVIAGLAAQGAAPEEAARYGACVHAAAADRAAGRGERGMLAGDLMAHLRTLVN